MLILMFVETSLEVSPALSPKPLAPTVEALPPPFIPSSLIFSRSWSFAGESGLGTAAAPVDACVGAEMQLLWPARSWLDFPCLGNKNPQFHLVLRAVLSNMGLFEGHFVLTLFHPYAQQVGGLKNPNVLSQPCCAGSAGELHPSPGYWCLQTVQSVLDPDSCCLLSSLVFNASPASLGHQLPEVTLGLTPHLAPHRRGQ